MDGNSDTDYVYAKQLRMFGVYCTPSVIKNCNQLAV